MTVAMLPMMGQAATAADPIPSFLDALESILRDRKAYGAEPRNALSFPAGRWQRFLVLRFLTPRVRAERLRDCVGRANADPIEWVEPGRLLIKEATVLESQVLWEVLLSLDEPFVADRAFFGF